MNRFLEVCGVPGGLDFFWNAQVVQECGMLEGVTTGRFDTGKFPAFSQMAAPATLEVCSDLEQIQVSGLCFVAEELRCTFARILDLFHRDCNDTAMARAKSGRTPVYLASIAILNVGYGP